MEKNASFICPAAHPPHLRRPAPRLLRRRRPDLHPGLPPLHLPPLRLHPPRRPWSELINRSTFSRPDSVTEAASRVRKNLSYFRVNYLALLAAVLVVSLLSHPFSLLILLSLLAAWCFLYLFRPVEPPLVFFGRTFSDCETLGALVFLTVLVIFLTSIGSLLISTLMVGAVIVAVHGAFRVPEDLFLDDQDPGGAYIFGMALLIASSSSSSSSPSSSLALTAPTSSPAAPTASTASPASPPGFATTSPTPTTRTRFGPASAPPMCARSSARSNPI